MLFLGSGAPGRGEGQVPPSAAAKRGWWCVQPLCQPFLPHLPEPTMAPQAFWGSISLLCCSFLSTAKGKRLWGRGCPGKRDGCSSRCTKSIPGLAALHRALQKPLNGEGRGAAMAAATKHLRGLGNLRDQGGPVGGQGTAESWGFSNCAQHANTETLWAGLGS